MVSAVISQQEELHFCDPEEDKASSKTDSYALVARKASTLNCI